MDHHRRAHAVDVSDELLKRSRPVGAGGVTITAEQLDVARVKDQMPDTCPDRRVVALRPRAVEQPVEAADQVARQKRLLRAVDQPVELGHGFPGRAERLVEEIGHQLVDTAGFVDVPHDPGGDVVAQPVRPPVVARLGVQKPGTGCVEPGNRAGQVLELSTTGRSRQIAVPCVDAVVFADAELAHASVFPPGDQILDRVAAFEKGRGDADDHARASPYVRRR